MGTYVMLTSLTDEGRKTLMERPERILEVNKEVESMGVKIVAQYAVLGPYDFVNILEAPTEADVSKVAIAIGGRGTLRTMTMSAMTIEDFTKGFQKEK